MTNLAIWDFDGTLARSPTWSVTLAEVLAEGWPAHALTAETIRPHLSRGFPWHEPGRLHPELAESTHWWRRVEGVLADALRAEGIPAAVAREAARAAHARYVDPARFTLVPGAEDALVGLRAEGWKHVILTNHVPELRSIADHLGLTPLVEDVVNSAESGVEKPHAEAFRLARAAGGIHATVWMLGDSYAADVAGAEAAGIPAILVHTRDARAPRQADDLTAAATLLRSLGSTEDSGA